VFVKNKVIDKQKYVVLRYDYNFFPDSLERLWTFDSTKAWVNTGTRSDTLLASSLSLGKIRSLVVSHNASVSAVRCDSGVAIFKVFHDPTPIRPLISSPANLAGKTNLKVQRFSLNGRAITDSKMFHNQIVIERGVDSKINKRLFMRN
jgi:hypothetical protein